MQRACSHHMALMPSSLAADDAKDNAAKLTKVKQRIDEMPYVHACHLQQLMVVLKQLLNIVSLVDPRRATLSKVLDCRRCCSALKPDEGISNDTTCSKLMTARLHIRTIHIAHVTGLKCDNRLVVCASDHLYD